MRTQHLREGQPLHEAEDGVERAVVHQADAAHLVAEVFVRPTHKVGEWRQRPSLAEATDLLIDVAQVGILIACGRTKSTVSTTSSPWVPKKPGRRTPNSRFPLRSRT